MAFYHDSRHSWTTNTLTSLLHWRNRVHQRVAQTIGGCVLCGASTRHSLSSPRLCPDCAHAMPNALPQYLDDEPIFRCRCCAHLLTTDDALCVDCLTDAPAFTHSVVFADYALQLQHALLSYKFHNALHLAPMLADGLRVALHHYAREHCPDVIVLVPQLAQRTRSRAMNPLRLIMQHIDVRDIWREHTPRYLPDALLRVHHERLQIHVKPDLRRKQVKNAFALGGQVNFKDAHVMVIDDIITTGATLNEIARVLKLAGAKQVDNVVIARTRKSPLK